MLYLVRMDVNLPVDMPQETAEAVKARSGVFPAAAAGRPLGASVAGCGEYSNYSVFDVPDHDELHELLSGLPLFPYMEIKVTPLAKYPLCCRIARTTSASLISKSFQ